MTAAFRCLFMAQRRARRPADVALGPALARLVERESFKVVEFFPYVLGRAREMSAKDFFSGMAQVVSVAAASLAPDAPEVVLCRDVLANAESTVGSATVGYGCPPVPAFICVANRPQPTS